MMQDDFFKMREAALAILQREARLTRKAGSFLGQCVAEPGPLTDRQAEWFAQLATRAGVPWDAAA